MFAHVIYAQNMMIKGTVIDANNDPLLGVTIMVKGTTTGTITDVDGNFSIKGKTGETLIVSYIGMQTQEVVFRGQPLKIMLKDDAQALEEVVVVGYGTMRKKDLTGSVIQVRPDKIANENPKTVQDILRGTPGLAIGYNADAKGGGSMNIRGQRSVYTDGNHNSPLLILDGMMFYGELSEINPDDIVISVVPVESPKAAVLAWNDRRIDRPASVAKVVTTLAALETLGANYRWYTGFYTLGEPTTKGLLKGGLFIRGGGDPAFVVEDFSMAVDKLAQTGIKRIEGNIVIDRSFFNIPQVDPGAFDGRSSRPYNLQPDPALINFRNLSFEFIPDKETQTARIVTVPKLAGISFPETIPLGRGGCGDWKTSIGFQLKDLGKGRKRVTFTGKLPAACGPKNFNVIALEPNEYLERLFRAFWERDGRTWTGHVVSGNVPKDAQRRFSRVSQPLGEVVALTNKWSNNLMARHIFLSLGADRVREAFNEAQKNESSTGKLKSAGKAAARAELVFPRGATLEDARAALDEWLQSKGITSQEIWIDNGSGLSRETRVTGRAMTQLLAAGWSGPYMPEYLASMPISGRDGTMAKRKVAEERGRIKTGFLSDVRSIGGFIQAQNGQRYAVYASVRGAKNVPNGIPFLNIVIDWVYDYSENKTR